ncbi:hypothetical protein ACQ4PT_068416 [Festuca glaucescens]
MADASGAGMGTVRECGDECACGPSCANRRTQRGVTVRLRVVRQLKKGWGLHAAQVLRRAQFVCEYAGTVVELSNSHSHEVAESFSKLSLNECLIDDLSSYTIVI